MEIQPIRNKKSGRCATFFCTGDRTRTYTSKILDPKSSASTNSATPAWQNASPLGTRCKSNSFFPKPTKPYLISIMLSIRSIMEGALSSRIRAIAGNRSVSEG